MHTSPWWGGIGSSVGLVCGDWTHAMAATPENWGPWGMHIMWGSWGIGMMLMMLF